MAVTRRQVAVVAGITVGLFWVGVGLGYLGWNEPDAAPFTWTPSYGPGR